MFGIDTQDSTPTAMLYRQAQKARAEYLADLLRSLAHRLGDLFNHAPHGGATTHG
ncbi:MAG: hypothetical protein K9H25_09720 [Rhodospirillum sp.]|nr:hypothetical protein [Rhodospirillum sp.]MCF8491680.1 hypothetical protein [Rhodospirillum sp.]MCF8501069.1 hypothetical protein [Rhodospirillum sp.]